MSQSETTGAISWMNAETVNFQGTTDRRRSDRDLADATVAAAKQLQDAMDAAIMAGLVIEPALKLVENRFAQVGVSSDSYLVNVGVWRKLS